MKRRLKFFLPVFITGIAVLTGTPCSGPAAYAAPKPKYVDPESKYLQKYVSVEDVWVGWLPGIDARPDLHVASARVLNRGKKAIIVLDVRVALLDQKGLVTAEKRVLNYPDGTPWQPHLDPAQAAVFSVPLPPTEGIFPPDWTGELRISVVSIQLP